MYHINEISKLINGKIIGEDNLEFSKLSPFFEADPEDLTFAADESMLKNIAGTKAKAVIVPVMEEYPDGKTYIVLEQNPRNVLPILLNFFKPKMQKPEKQIEDSAKISENAMIGINSYIGHNVEIGENTVIHPNVTIMEGVKIGKNSIIYSNAVIREFCVLGENVILQPGAVIGADGFGFAPTPNGYDKIPQIGIVILEDKVDIGANTCVDRATMGATVVHSGVKLDNLIQIAHNDEIGSHTVMAAQAGIAGSTKIGEWCMIGGQVGIAGHSKIGDKVGLGAQSGVPGDIKSGSQLIGTPPMELKQYFKASVAQRSLPDMQKELRNLRKEVEELKQLLNK